MSPEYEVGTWSSVRAFHRFPGAEGAEAELHPHDYRVEVVVGRTELDYRGMVCDLDVLEAALSEVVKRVEGIDLEAIRPASADAVTVEIFARWAHAALAEPLRREGAESLSVRVWESETAFGGYRAPLV